MKKSINSIYRQVPAVTVASLKQGQNSTTGKSKVDTSTAGNFKMFLQGIDGNLEAGFVAGFLFRGYICTSSIPEICEIFPNDILELTDGRKFQIDGVLLQDSNPIIKPFFKLELKKI
jgi:hypothetical protein